MWIPRPIWSKPERGFKPVHDAGPGEPRGLSLTPLRSTVSLFTAVQSLLPAGQEYAELRMSFWNSKMIGIRHMLHHLERAAGSGPHMLEEA